MLHYRLSPANEKVHEEYLKLLGDAGFDSVLEKMGKYFGYDGLAVYYLSFHAVSYAPNGGFMHVDFSNTNSKAWNVLVPLILANETGPELGLLRTDPITDETRLGLYKYEEDVAMIMGDDCEHVTAKADYRGTDNMRMVAIIYIADVNVDNLEGVLDSYFGQSFPPEEDVDWLLSQAGRHWGKGHSLPKHLDAKEEASGAKSESQEESTQAPPLTPEEVEIKENEDALQRVVQAYMMSFNATTDDEVAIRDINRLFGDRFPRNVLARAISQARGLAAIKAKEEESVVVRDTFYADRFVHELLMTVADPDCMSGEFDVTDESYDPYEAIEVLHKCKVLVLRNVFNEKFLKDYRKGFTSYIQGVHDGTVKPSNTSLHNIDRKRWQVDLPKELADKDIISDVDVMDILSQDEILGSDLVLQSLSGALTERKAKEQKWQANQYLFSKASFPLSGVAGHDLPAVTISMEAPLSDDHESTEFCIGSSLLSGLNSKQADIMLKDNNLRPWLVKYRRGLEKNKCPYPRTPKLSAGDVLLFDPQVAHRGEGNPSENLHSILHASYTREWYRDINLEFEAVVDEQGSEGDEDEMEGGADEDELEGEGEEEEEEEQEEEEEETSLYDQLTRASRFAASDKMMMKHRKRGAKIENIEKFRVTG